MFQKSAINILWYFISLDRWDNEDANNWKDICPPLRDIWSHKYLKGYLIYFENFFLKNARAWMLWNFTYQHNYMNLYCKICFTYWKINHQNAHIWPELEDTCMGVNVRGKVICFPGKLTLFSLRNVHLYLW